MQSPIPLSSRPNAPWNKGCLIGQKRPLKPKEVWAIRARLQLERCKRDLALFNLAIDSKLRGCDLVRLKFDDIYVAGRVRERGTVIQKKTGRPVQFEITEQTRAAVANWLSELAPTKEGYLFPSRFRAQPSLDAAICPHCPCLGSERGPRQFGLGDTLDAAGESSADLQEDREPSSGSASARTHQAGKHRALSRH